MKSPPIFSYFKVLLPVGILFLTATCGKEDECNNAKAGCCCCFKAAIDVYFNGNYYDDCICIPDSSLECPANVVNGYYDFDFCECRCQLGWTGAHCDQVDSSNFIRFRHGSDTTALSEIITTHDGAIINDVLQGSFPSGAEIDSVKIAGLPFYYGLGVDSIPLCGWDCGIFFSSYLKLSFSNGETAYSLSGILIIDTVTTWYDPWGNSNPKYHGTFNSDLYVIETGQTYYVRDGAFSAYGSY